MFVHAKIEERRRARELRSENWSLRRIATELGASLSSVSVWVRDIPGEATVACWKPLRTQRPKTITERRPGEPALQRCSQCCWVLPIEFFNRNGARRQWYCKACFR